MSNVRNMARFSGAPRLAAALLQKKGRGNDKVLAHITRKEAALLHALGGRGSLHPETGLLELDDGVPDAPMDGSQDFTPPPEQPQEPVAAPDVSAPPTDYSYAAPPTDFSVPAAPAAVPQENQFGAAQQYPEADFYQMPAAAAVPTPGAAPPQQAFPYPEDPTAPSTTTQPAPAAAPQEGTAGKIGDYLSQKLTDPSVLARLGITGLSAIPGLIQGRRAQKQAQAASAQQRAIAAPYQAQGQQLQALSQAGQLTPASQQQLDAVRAQMEQAQSARGGVGAIQAQGEVERVRQQLLQSQADFGVKLSSIGDQIALGAIQTGLQADRYVQGLQAQYFQGIARMLGGFLPQGGQSGGG